MLLHHALGDAYGAGFEFAPPALVLAHNDLSGYIQHRTHKKVLPGMYTDDTQMAISIAEAVLADDLVGRSLCDRFVNGYKRDPRTGYSSRFYNILNDPTLTDGVEFFRRINPMSERTGAAMRVAAVGLIKDIHWLLSVSTMQAGLTHATPTGIHSSNAAALMVHFFAYEDEPKDRLGVFLDRIVPDPAEGKHWTDPYCEFVDGNGLGAVHAAVWAILNNSTMSGILKQCIGYCGDVDTVAAMAMSAASLAKDIKQDLPQHLYDNLENGPYGRDFLVELDKNLFDKFGIVR